ncbi:Uncharacterised protein [Segatella copri]|nr:Uncharacterised protein [Segatella copri]
MAKGICVSPSATVRLPLGSNILGNVIILPNSFMFISSCMGRFPIQSLPDALPCRGAG